MDKEKMAQASIDIREAAWVTEATLKTVCNDNSLKSDRLEWVLNGLLDQMEKIKKAEKAIDEEMGA